MVDRQIGQPSLIDELMPAPRQTMLDRLAAGLDWQPIQTLLGPRTQGPGAPGYPPLVLLRALMLGLWYDLSDPALEAAIADRLSFRRFCGLSLTDPVPDHSTLWRFRAALAKDGRIDQVFAEITRQLEAKGLILKQGTLIDASLVPARAAPPRTPKPDQAGAATPPKPAADAHARWGRKGRKSVFGYKIHIGVDHSHTLIRRVEVTDASVTDTEPADRLICGDEAAVYGDQAYYTHARHGWLQAAGIKDRLMRRPNKHHPELPKRHKQRNRLIGKVRAGVERPFAVLKERYGLRRMRFFSLARNRVQVVLGCCAYNLRRAVSVLCLA